MLDFHIRGVQFVAPKGDVKRNWRPNIRVGGSGNPLQQSGIKRANHRPMEDWRSL